MGQYQIQCNKCGFNGFFHQRPMSYHYLLPDSTKFLMLHHDIGWCQACGTVTEVESFDPTKSVEDYQNNARRMNREFKRRKYPKTPENLGYMAHARDAARWRELRTSPPRCLRCGSTRIEVWNLSHELSCSPGHATHPGCGGTLRKVAEWETFEWEWDREVLFTVDGERIKSVGDTAIGAASGLLTGMRDGLSRLLHGGLQKPLQVRQAQVPDFPAQLLSDQAVDAGDADPAQVDESAVPSSPPDAVLAIPPIPAGPLSESAHSLGQEPPPLPPEEMARQFFRRVLTGESVTQEEQNRMEALGLAQEAVAKICAEVMADMAIQEFGSVESVRKCLGMLGPESESSAVVPPPLPSVPQPLGPSPKEIFQVLAPFAPHRDLFLSPDIPAKKLNNAGQACVVPNDEAIICLIDCTVFGNAKNALLFGACAIYYHNDWTCTQRGRGVLPYAEFANRAFFKKSGSEVALGGDQFINRAGSSVAADTIVAMLNAIKNLLANREASGGTAAPQTEDPAVADEPGVSSEEVLRQTLRRLLPPGGATDAERTEVQRLCMEPSAPESAGRILREVEAELGIVHEGSKKMENVRLKCPACGKGLRVGEKLAGRESSCPACHARLLVSPDCRQLTQVPDGTRSAGRKTLPVACKLPESEESGSQTPVSVVSPRPPVPATATPDTVGCPHCSGGIANDPQYAGQEVGCPHCQGRVVMPDMTSVVPAEVVSESVEPGVLDFLQSDGSSGNAHQSADGDTTLARADRHYWAGEKFKAAPLYMDHMNECPDDAIASSRLAVCLAMMCSEAMSKGVPVDSEMSAMAFKALTQAWAFAPNDPIVLRNEYCVLRELGVLQDAIDESEEMAAKFDPSVFTPPDGPS